MCKPLFHRLNNELLSSYLAFAQEDDIAYINCGTGSLSGGSALVKSSGSKFFSGDRGFCLFEMTADGLITKFISGENGETLYEHKQPVKTRPERSTVGHPSCW